IREECVLLGFVEAVNFINEEDGTRTVGGGFLRVGHDLLDFFYAGEDGRELDEGGFGGFGDDFCEGGLTDSRRPPKDHRRGIISFNLDPQWLARAKQMLLANVLVERLRAHALGEWRVSCCDT